VMTYRDITSTGDGLRARTAISGNLTYVYGGKLTENLVQAVAREVFVDRMLALNDALPGQLRFHVHDEYILEVPTDVMPTQMAKVQQVIKEAEDISWLKGCPIDADLHVVNRYTKS
jgi:DNA polymerase bacteriophage-type